MRLPSGATPTPWFTSIPEITPTTLFVTGSMMWTLSPALFVWIIRTLFCAAKEIYPDVEMIRMDQINEAYERLLNNDVRYRFVVDMSQGL